MSSLTREVAFGATSGFKTQGEFTAPEPSAPRFHATSDPGNLLGRRTLEPHPLHAASTPLLDEALLCAAEAGAARQHGGQDEENRPLLAAAQAAARGAEPGQPLPLTLREEKALESFSRRVRIGINASWVVNITLLIAKVVAFAVSMSYSVLASAVDSLVDLLSQGLLAVAEYQAATFDPRYPIGRTRMADLSVIGCAVVMFVSTALVIREAAGAMWVGFHGHLPTLEVGPLMYVILGVASVAKLALWLYCRTLYKNPIMVALAQDHLNDVMSNVAAVAGAAIASNYPKAWWADPVMALLFSLLIIRNWILIVKEQTDNIIGLGAPEELTEEVTEATNNHHPGLKLDRITAYHHGAHYVVEVEVVLPADMTVRESHDIALTLQHKVEALESVERAFVHVDYRTRSMDEHKVERNLKLGEKDVMKALTPSEAHASLTEGLARSLSPHRSGAVFISTSTGDNGSSPGGGRSSSTPGGASPGVSSPAARWSRGGGAHGSGELVLNEMPSGGLAAAAVAGGLVPEPASFGFGRGSGAGAGAGVAKGAEDAV